MGTDDKGIIGGTSDEAEKAMDEAADKAARGEDAQDDRVSGDARRTDTGVQENH